MIEFSKIKKITIKEGVVKKITNSSGVVLWSEPSTDTGSITVDLNNQWVDSTKKLDGYVVFMSNSNKGVDNGYSSMKIKFKGEPDFKIWINSYAESSYDYTIAFDMDVDYPTSNPSSGKLDTKGFQKDPTSIDNFKEVDYPNDGGEHFVVVTFRKDSSGNNSDDRGYVAIKVGKLLSTSWVASSTEFIKDSDKYYEKINEVGTYEGGLTAATGNFKSGNELTPTYIQSSDANDYMLVGSSIYYKKYAYVTPVDTAINTGDYIQGDYIREATPSMKVTYTDNTEKTFYELTSIEKDTDANKKNAKNVEIYDSITSIGDSAFHSCSSLTSITIPNSVTFIDSSAFSSCKSLQSINIPNSVTFIGSSAFAFCKSLQSIVIPSEYTNFQYGLFYNCSSLSSVTIENSAQKATQNSNVFYGISPTAKLYVPSNLLSEYQADTNWTGAFPGGIEAIAPSMKVTYTDNTEKEFYNLTSIEQDTDANKANAKNVEIYDSVTSIGNAAFRDCSSLTSVTIPDSVTSIGYGAFGNCSGLTSVTIPDSVTNIGNYAFYGCSSLTSVAIGNGVTSIGNNAFRICSSLISVSIGSGVTSIGDDAFEGCSRLSSVTIPNSVTSIGTTAFFKCLNLSSVTIENSSAKLAAYNGQFINISKTAKLYVPSNLLADYQADADWTGAFPGGIYAIDS